MPQVLKADPTQAGRLRAGLKHVRDDRPMERPPSVGRQLEVQIVVPLRPQVQALFQLPALVGIATSRLLSLVLTSTNWLRLPIRWSDRSTRSVQVSRSAASHVRSRFSAYRRPVVRAIA